MSTPYERAMWAQVTNIRAAQARKDELEGLYAHIEELEESRDLWRELAYDLVRNGARLPKLPA